jgi:hypothetical protein
MLDNEVVQVLAGAVVVLRHDNAHPGSLHQRFDATGDVFPERSVPQSNKLICDDGEVKLLIKDSAGGKTKSVHVIDLTTA